VCQSHWIKFGCSVGKPLARQIIACKVPCVLIEPSGIPFLWISIFPKTTKLKWDLPDRKVFRACYGWLFVGRGTGNKDKDRRTFAFISSLPDINIEIFPSTKFRIGFIIFNLWQCQPETMKHISTLNLVKCGSVVTVVMSLKLPYSRHPFPSQARPGIFTNCIRPGLIEVIPLK